MFYQKNRKNPVKNYFNFFSRKFLSTCFITANRPEGADCGEWLRLMHEYSYNGTGIPPKSIFRSFFSSNDNPNDQKEVAHQVVLACDEAQLSTKRPIQQCINDIKKWLETGLLAKNLHPQDNFPKIVKAIANQTAGIKQWEFSPNAMERLNQIETANRLER